MSELELLYGIVKMLGCIAALITVCWFGTMWKLLQVKQDISEILDMLMEDNDATD